MTNADSARYVDEEIARIRRRSIEFEKRLEENGQDRVEHRKWLAEHARQFAEQPRWFSDAV